MGTTEVQAAAAEGDGLELTELEKLEVTRIDGVASPANGFPVLLMKGLPGARLEPPTQEGFTGPYGGVPAPAPAAAAGCGCCADCQCPPGAAKSAGVPDGIAKQAEAAAQEILKAYASIEGDWSYMDGPLVKRTFTAQQRRDLAARGQALADGTYPIENTDDLGNAAGLARSKHGNWKAAMRLIAKMARKLGVSNPLKKKPKSSSGGGGAAKSTVAEGEAEVDTGAQDEQIATLVQAEVAKALKPHEEREQALEAELAKANAKIAEFAAMPIPGGPVMRAVAPTEPGVKKAELIAKAEEFEELARTVSDPERSANFAKLAAQKRAEAAQA